MTSLVTNVDLDERWASIQAFLSRKTSFGMETGALKFVDDMSFEPDPELFEMVKSAKVLCVGAGGLGCEILKDLALTGFQDIHVIDLDTIDVTNLNRQFLFRKKDVGRDKATVAAEFVNNRVPGVNVIPHFGKLQDFGPEWFSEFNIVVAGLDNIEARRWLNQMLCSLVRYEEDGSGNIDMTTVIPLIDGGTEGLKGQARVILPMKTSCFECTMNMFPPAQTKAVCTLENNPRQPSDCAIYVFMKIEDDESMLETGTVYSKNEQVCFTFNGKEEYGIVEENENGTEIDMSAPSPSSDENAMMVDENTEEEEVTYSLRVAGGVVRKGVKGSEMANIREQWLADFGTAKVDKDRREHMSWIHERAAARAVLFNITGLTYDRTLGSVKNIIPAVASTNAVIASACVLEAFKCLTFSGQLCNTYLLYNGQSMAGGVSCDTMVFERDPECLACQDTKEKQVSVPTDIKVGDFVQTYVLAAGALDLSMFGESSGLTPPSQPMLYDSSGDCFYCVTGALAAMKAQNIGEPLSSLVDDGEVVTITDALWGKNLKRCLKVKYV